MVLKGETKMLLALQILPWVLLVATIGVLVRTRRPRYWSDGLPPVLTGAENMTIDYRTRVEGLDLTVGDVLFRFREGDAAKAKLVRIVSLEGTPVLMTPAATLALATALQTLAVKQENRPPLAASLGGD